MSSTEYVSPHADRRSHEHVPFLPASSSVNASSRHAAAFTDGDNDGGVDGEHVYVDHTADKQRRRHDNASVHADDRGGGGDDDDDDGYYYSSGGSRRHSTSSYASDVTAPLPPSLLPGGGVDRRLSAFELVACTVALLGIQFAWSVEFAVVTPYLNSLGLPASFNHLAWIAGPISGFIVAPVVGVYSDRCTLTWGRRRPFILLGLTTTVFAMAALSNSKDLGELLGDTEERRTSAIVIALVAFLLCDLSVNTIQGPLRALISDLCAAEQQNTGQAMATVMQGLGAIGGNLVCFLLDPPTEKIRWIFMVGYVLMCVTTAFTMRFAVEQPLTEHAVALLDEAAAERLGVSSIECCRSPVIAPFRAVGLALVRMTPPMRRLCAVQFLSWSAWFLFLPSVTNYFGAVVMSGDARAAASTPSGAAYQDGVRAAALAMIFQAVVQFATSFALPPLVARVGMRRIYFTSMASLAGCLMGLAWLRNRYACMALTAATGFAFATTNTFPFALVGQYFRDASAQGVNIGILNWFIVVPQMVDTAWSGFAAGKREHASLLRGDSFVFAIASCFAALAALGTLLIITSPHDEPESDEQREKREREERTATLG